MSFAALPDEVASAARAVVDASFKVHKSLGPGLLESVYEACLCYELTKRSLRFQSQLSVPVVYEELSIETGLRLDLLVADCLVVELKAVEKVIPVFESQLLTYLKLTGLRLGLLINFNVPIIKDGIKRVIR